MGRSFSQSTGRRYGVVAVTRVWGFARATLYRHRLPAGSSSASIRQSVCAGGRSRRTAGVPIECRIAGLASSPALDAETTTSPFT